MARLSIKRPYLLAAIVIVCWIGLAIALPFPVCHDRKLIDEHTGSRKGFRQWITGGRSSHWYHESKLETFLRTHHPDRLVQRWTSYAGTGRNLIGSAIESGHGQPGPIILLSSETLDDYCDALTEDELLGFYETLTGTDPARLDELVDQILIDAH